jgi:hypothetical protein
MSEPIVFISHNQIKKGKLDELTRVSGEATTRLQAEKPRTLVFLAFVDEGGTQATFVHVFADAESMDLHFEGAEERSTAAYEYLNPAGWEIYGRPSKAVIEVMRQTAASAGVTLIVQPEYLAGFLRLTEG